jgi:hypothetical protein
MVSEGAWIRADLEKGEIKKPSLFGEGWKYRKTLILSGFHHLAQLAFQVASFILMNNAPFHQFIDLANHSGERFYSLFTFQGFEVPDRVTCCFTVVTVAVPAFAGLTDIFLGSLMICHNCTVLEIRTAKVREKSGLHQKNNVINVMNVGM